MAVAIALDATAISESLWTQSPGGLALAAGWRGYAVQMSFVSHDETPAVPRRVGDGPASQTRGIVADRGSGD